MAPRTTGRIFLAARKSIHGGLNSASCLVTQEDSTLLSDGLAELSYVRNICRLRGFTSHGREVRGYKDVSTPSAKGTDTADYMPVVWKVVAFVNHSKKF